MRRLWAYIIVVFTALVVVFASFPTIIKGVQTNGNYETRRQFTFQLTEREKEDDDVEPAKLDDNSAKSIASIMRDRLERYNISSYDISTSGQDIVTVSFAANSEDKYQQIITYLSFSGSFALTNGSDEVVVAGKDFIRGKAYTKDYAVNEYPTVIIPVKTDSTDYQTIIQGAKDSPVSTGSEEEGEEGEQVARIYLLFNWNKGETYQSLSDANLLESKTLMQIDFTPDDEETGLYYNSNKNSFSRVCGFEDSNGNGMADASEVAAAYDRAEYLVNLFSASALDYEVKCIRGLTDSTKVWLNAKVENVLDSGKLVWNRTLTAVIAAIVIITLLLAYFYKLGAVSTLATTLLSAFFAILIMVQTGLEYNALAVVAIIIVALTSIVSGIIYLNKLKEDCYKGHTIKKANAEASKKSLLPITDIHLVTLIVGVMCYLLGGTALRSFGAILGICSVISYIINTLGLKGIMWLSTNATAVNGRYDLFAINKENVPDHMAEEKQTFYGTYANKRFSRHKKSVGIITSLAFVGALVGIIVAGSLRNGNLFKPSTSQTLGQEIYIQNRIVVTHDDDKSPLTDYTLVSILDDILVQRKTDTPIDRTQEADASGVAESYYTLKYFVDMDKNITFSLSETKIIDKVAHNYLDTYYILSLKHSLNVNSNAVIKSDASMEPVALSELLGEEYFKATGTFSPSEEAPSTINAKNIKTVVANNSVKWDKVILASSIAVLILTVYLLLRYRLSRGLVSLLFPVVSATITLGVMLLINFFVTIPAAVAIAVPVVSILSYFFMIQFFNKERELISEDKVKDNSPEHRSELAMRALGIAYTPILATAVLGIYCLINFFGFGTADMSLAYVAMFVGGIIALAIISVLIVPLCNFLFKQFSKVHINRKPRANKKNKKPVKKSAEPEEAIFIGIND